MEILKMVLNMSITGSIIFLILQLIKPLTKKNFSHTWHYKMSIIILIFFVVPIGNFINFPRISDGIILRRSQVEIQKPSNLDAIVKKEDTQDVPEIQDIEKGYNEEGYNDEIKYKNSTLIETKTDGYTEKTFNISSYKDAILYIWLIGMIALFLSKIIPYIKFKAAILESSTEVEDTEIIEIFNQCKYELNINKNINLKSCQYIGSPMLIGILNPMILIPNANEDRKTLKMIFLHELNHYKRKDILIKAFGFIVNIIHWFNPFIYLLLKDMDNYCECSIDEKVVGEMEIEDRKYYGETILKLIDSSNSRRYTLTTAMSSNGLELKSRLENMLFFKKNSKKRLIISLLVMTIIIFSGFTIACSIMPTRTVDEKDVDKLYELKGGKIGDNSRVGNIINLLDFPKDLEPNGIELSTKEEPYGLQINFSADTDTKMKYIAMSSDEVWRSQSLILFSLIDNLNYIKYAIDDGKGNIVVSSINREQADSITVSVVGHRTSHIAKNKKRFKEFYDIFGSINNVENQYTSNIKSIEIIFNKDNIYFSNKGPISITDKKMINDIVYILEESQPIQNEEKMNNIRDMAYKDNKLILTNIDNEKSEIKFTFDTLYEIGFIEMNDEELEPKYDLFRYILDLIEYEKYETNIDKEVVELFKEYNWTVDYKVNTIKEKLPSDLKHEAGEHPTKIYWAYNKELSKSIGLDFSKYLGNTVVAEIYRLREPLPEYMKPMLNARGIVLKKDGKIIGAYIDAGRHESFACSLNRKSLEDIVKKDWDKWIKDYIDYDNKLEKELAQLSPEEVIKTYFEALNSHNIKRAKACLARTKSNINLDLSANMSNIELYNKKADDYYNNIKSVSLLGIKRLNNENMDSNILKYQANAEYKYKKVMTHEDGVLPYTVFMRKESERSGWKIEDIGF